MKMKILNIFIVLLSCTYFSNAQESKVKSYRHLSLHHTILPGLTDPIEIGISYNHSLNKRWGLSYNYRVKKSLRILKILVFCNLGH